jgi:hypothetical protein
MAAQAAIRRRTIAVLMRIPPSFSVAQILGLGAQERNALPANLRTGKRATKKPAP